MWIFGAMVALVNVGFAADYTIKNYDVNMELRTDGSMLVNETIDVNFSAQKHGILRKIATKNPNNGRVVSISSPMVEWDKFQVSREKDMFKFKIWDPNATVYGDHKYRISYVVDNAIVSFGSGAWQELYWNVIGTEWTTSIDKAYFSLKLPKDYVSNGDRYYAVRGNNGERKKENLIFDLVWSEEFRWNLKQYMRAGEGLTVYVPFASGYFEFPEDYRNYFEQKVQIPGMVMEQSDQRNWAYIGFVLSYLKNPGVCLCLCGLILYWAILWVPYLLLRKSISLEVEKTIDRLRWYHIKISYYCSVCNFYLLFWGILLLFVLRTFHYISEIDTAIILGLHLIIGFWWLCFVNYDYKYKGKKPIIPYYLPPKDLDIYALFAFSVKHGLSKDFVAPIFLYWASQGKITISYKERSVDFGLFWYSYVFSRKTILQKNDNNFSKLVPDEIFSSFFWNHSQIKLSHEFISNIYKKITLLEDQVDGYYNEDLYVETREVWGLFYYTTLNSEGRALYDQLRGFKYYLETVERPQIELLLKDDPEYINKILPWIVLFGLQNKLAKQIEDLMQQTIQQWGTGDWDLSAMKIMTGLNSCVYSNDHKPISSSSDHDSDRGSGGGSSGSSDSWSSGGWGWWGWGDSW